MRRPVRLRVCFLLGLLSLPAAARGDDKIDFATQIQPILVAKCAGCHGEKKAAAKLRLDSADQINAFGEKDHLLVAGKPDESELYQRLVLPADDKKRMPKGPDGLPDAEIALIKQWIEQGAVLAVAAAATPAPAPADAPMAADEAAKKKAAEEAKAAEAALKAADEAELAKVTAAPAEAIEKVKQAGGSVMPLYGESPLLQVSFARSDSPAGDAALAALAGVADQVVWLDLSGAQATGAGWGQVAALKNLNRLHLEKSSVDDASLAGIAALPRLEYLNLYATGVTDAGLEHLKAAKRLRKLYLWQTKVGYDPALALQGATPGLEVNLGWDHPGVVKARLTKELEIAKKSVEESTAKATEAQKTLEAANAEKTAAEAKLKEVDDQLKALEAPPVAEATTPAAEAAAPAPAAEAAPTAEAAPAEQAAAK
ncbi:c-type cytochrome domain-containing protein [Lacipirellula parvula]|uniref:Cytochrome c domain-containing protein n=1 Tax=Lacipirellula parvula TaxID=2650471 RepID=A0A5K7XNL7_9BACT|nr:c-type cytochrome domain-containing protein [Lacipirellula parvula]BBO34769.1 hypothetical protein PLANPX_4381 [Lacipirellula parvula]